MSGKKRAVVRFAGRVQGVGFRYTVVHVASDYKVSGFVQNEMDGSVLICTEGEEGEILEFVQAIKRSAVGRFIFNESVRWDDATDEYRGFTVRYG